MLYLSLAQILDLHHHLIEQSGGTFGIRDIGALESALAQPQMTFGGAELYPTVIEKASALGFSLVMNHPFMDGNKRVGHAAMEVFLVVNGFEIRAGIEEQEQLLLNLAAGQLRREEFTDWIAHHLIPIER